MWTPSLWGFIVVTEIRETVPIVVFPAVTCEDRHLRTCTALDPSWHFISYEELICVCVCGGVTHNVQLFLLASMSSLFI